MPPVGFEPTISAGERPQTYALDRAATGTDAFNLTNNNNNNNNNKQHEETIEHLNSECPILAKNEYLMRHDKVCTRLH